MALTEERKQEIKNGYESVLRGIEEARRAGAGQEVTLVAASKTRSAEEINYAASLGLLNIGENRVQELLAKYDALSPSLNIHFIGSLQKNKVKYIIDKVCLIHSVDSLALAEEIDKQAQKHGKIMDVLVEVNLGEANKGGVPQAELDSLLREMAKLAHLRVCGLMAVPPISHNFDEQFSISRKFMKVYIDNRDKNIDNIGMQIISFGMSEDYPAAIRAGSTLIRVGSAIFGARDYTNKQVQ